MSKPTPIKPVDILLVEDNPGDARLIREMLAEPTAADQTASFRLVHADRLAAGLALLAKAAADVILLDLSLPDSQDLDTFLRVRAAAPETPIVVLTGLGDETTGLKAIQAGAQDYLVKGQVDGNVLGRAVRYAIERQGLTRALRELNATLEARVTERTAELRAANERLITLERLKSQFLANASHELRTPLTNIKTSLYLLERGKPEKREKYMTTLNNETELLQSLLEDLLDAAALDFGRARPALAPVEPGQFLTKLVETRLPLVAERNLRLELAADPATPPVLADARMLRQALKAVLGDAADHEAAGRRIALHVQPFAAAERGWVALTIGGDAATPTPEEQARLFELADAAAGSSQAPPADPNLRLAICREIIAHHGGCMAVQLRAGRSSLVTLWLPAAD